MTYNLEDKKNIIYLRNQLINGDEEVLKRIYSSKADYGFFIDILNIALSTEPIFFILNDDIFLKAESLLQHRRFDYKDPNFTAIINEIIEKMNHLRRMPEDIRRIQRRQYMLWQRQQRETHFSSEEDFYAALSYDAVLMEKLYCRSLGETDPIYFFGSTNYLAKMLPEFYQADPTRITLTMQRLDQYATMRGFKHWPERGFAKDAIKNIQKVKTKEE